MQPPKVGYEIYIRSFLDSNGDGVGDLAGITAKLGYLADLGVDSVWITPFFPSPGFDHGYDVSDYLDIDPQFGTLDDFDDLVAVAHGHDLRLFVDIVPNHTSHRHPWFLAALVDLSSSYRDFYIFRPPAADGGPPNNWVSHFGGPAWTLDPAGSGNYYLHMFLPEQPDLNWANPAVHAEFAAILRFWCERGVDGFRIDVAHGLTKDEDFADNPQIRPITADMGPIEVFQSFDHVNDVNRPETKEVYREWRQIVAPYGALLLGELDTPDFNRFRHFVAGGDALDYAFVLKLSTMSWDPQGWIDLILDYHDSAGGGAAWCISNHDQPRGVSRFGGGALGLRRVMAVTALITALDGFTFIYQGEELGLPDAVVVGASQDPLTVRNDGAAGRDVARGPMPWTPGRRNGFTSGESTWLATAELPPDLTVEVQLADPTSTWWRYRELAQLVRRLPELTSEPISDMSRQPTVVAFRRGRQLVVANLGDGGFQLDLAGGAEVEYESAPGSIEFASTSATATASAPASGQSPPAPTSDATSSGRASVTVMIAPATTVVLTVDPDQ